MKKDKVEYTDEYIISEYSRLKSSHKVGKKLGISFQHVCTVLKRNNVETNWSKRLWSESDIQRMIDFYGNNPNEMNLSELEKILKRRKSDICKKAGELGLTKVDRSQTDLSKKRNSESSKVWHENNEHPRGFLGGKHSEETKKKLSTMKLEYAKLNKEKFLNETIMKILKTKWEKGNLYNMRGDKTTWKAGWYKIGDKKIYMRSSWEYNYALILEKRIKLKIIKKWEYEADIFWFENIKRGTRSYCPDFKIFNNDDSIEYHEVKGWMDAKSKTKLKRMAKYYPEIKLILIDSKEYHKVIKAGI